MCYSNIRCTHCNYYSRVALVSFSTCGGVATVWEQLLNESGIWLSRYSTCISSCFFPPVSPSVNNFVTFFYHRRSCHLSCVWCGYEAFEETPLTHHTAASTYPFLSLLSCLLLHGEVSNSFDRLVFDMCSCWMCSRWADCLDDWIKRLEQWQTQPVVNKVRVCVCAHVHVHTCMLVCVCL